MTAPMTAVATAAASVPRLYPIGGVPSTPTYPYGVFSAALGRTYAYALDSETRARYGRVTLQTFGRTANAALDHMDKLIAALLDMRLVVAGWDPSPLRMELEPRVTRDPDDSGVVGVTAALSFTATKEI